MIRHITVSGDLGSGKSTVAKLLSQALEMPVVSTGDIHRNIARSLNMSTLETNLLAERDQVIDSQVDGVTREMSRTANEPIVFDSRIAWFMVNSAFKVRLLTDADVAATRIHSRASSDVEGYNSIEHAKSLISQRYQSEVRRFMARYGVDVTYLKHFHLVIDTSDVDQTRVAELIANEYESGRSGGTKIYASPRRLIPAFDLMPPHSPAESAGETLVAYARPFMFALTGRKPIGEAIHDRVPLIPVRLAAEGLESLRDGLTANDLRDSWVSAESMATWSQELGGLTFDSFAEWLKERST